MAKRKETREIIINAATKIFFKNGFENSSVKMILDEANVVTGSFYHFFSSKEALFEAVVERYLENYSLQITQIVQDDSQDMENLLRCVWDLLQETLKIYYDGLQGDKLHWTIQYALHDKTLEAMVKPLKKAITLRKENRSIESRLNVDDLTLAQILIKGTEAIIHSGSETVFDDVMAFWRTILIF